jgi:beta-glucosidase
VHVSVAVRNSGTRDGDEVVQAYLRVPQVPGAPRIALRGFARVTLKAGETRTVQLELSPRDLSAVDPDGRRMVVAGHYRLDLGGGQPGSGLPGVSTEFDVAHAVDLPL